MKFIFVFYFSVWSFVLEASSVKNIPAAQMGCLKELSLSEAHQAIARFRLTTVRATDDEVQTLGKALVWIETLNSGVTPDWAVNTGDELFRFAYFDEDKNSNQTSGQINIRRRGRELGLNVAQLVHEYGHYVGNKGLYDKYKKSVRGEKCIVSEYSKTNFHERFAELFAAFVTVPNLIIENQKSCANTWNFMIQVFGRGEIAKDCAEEHQKSGLLNLTNEL
jgi:hypothetical protein